MTAGLQDAVEGALATVVADMVPVSGGDVASSFVVTLADGARVFAKTHPHPPPGFFTTEAAGLAWLRAADAVAVPAVLAVSDGGLGSPPFLVLEWIEVGSPTASTEADLGRALAALHDSGAPCFGREDRRTTGSRGLPNDPAPTWSEFYRERRLLPLARLATDTGALPPGAVSGLKTLAASLERFDDGAPPARLHGDLWAGNRLVDGAGRSWLIDPAAHGGHPELDLAMMRLFGGFAPDCFAAYQERHPLAEGWQDRVLLHQVAPLVVHALKFGGGYVRAAVDAVERYR